MRTPSCCRHALKRYALQLLLISTMGCATAGGDFDLSGLVSEDELPDLDRRLWSESRYGTEYLRKAGVVYADSVLGDYVQSVGMRLVPAHLQESVVSFSFHVIRDPELNAFALPDGTIFIHAGLVARLENESQLAQVLGHEIVHVVNRHGVHNYARTKNISVAAQLASLAVFGVVTERAPRNVLFWNLLTQASVYLTASAAINGYGRAREAEADLAALDYMVTANYDVTEAPRVFDHLLEEYDDPWAPVAFFFADHPRTVARREYVSSRVAEMSAGASVATGRETMGNDEYAARTRVVRHSMVELWVENGRYDRAVRDAERLLEADPEDAEVWLWFGEALRHMSSDPDTLDLAESKYAACASLDPTMAEPHRGLAAIAEARATVMEAVREYRMYLALSPSPSDGPYVRRRIRELSETRLKDPAARP